MSKIILLLAFVFLCAGVAGRMDIEDAKVDQANYCRGVEAKQWPDYRGNYVEDCK